MGQYLVTGGPEADVSDVHQELWNRYFITFEAARVPGLDADAWQEPAMDALLEAHPSLFLCGGAANQLNTHGRFNLVFLLDTGELDAEFRNKAIALGAICIETAEPPKKIVQTIIDTVNGLR